MKAFIRTNKVLLLLIAAFLVYQVILIEYSHTEFPTKITTQNIFPYLADKPISEDGYYMLTVAWNIASGKGFVYNYDVPTTGVQPLATITYAGIAKTAQLSNIGKIGFIKLVMYYSIFLDIAIWILLFIITKKIFPVEKYNLLKIVTFLLVPLNLQISIHVINGLETGLYLILLLCSFYFSMSYNYSNKRITKQTLLLSLLFSLTLLARLDFAWIMLILISGLFFTKNIRSKEALTLVFLPIMAGSLWSIYSYFITNSIIQSSVDSQTHLFASINYDGIIIFLQSFLQPFIPFIYSGNKRMLFILVIVPLFSIGIAWYFRYYLTKWKAPFNQTVFLIWSASLITLPFVYLIYSNAPHFFVRYFSPLFVITLPVQAYLIYLVLEKFSLLKRFGFIALVMLIYAIQSSLYFHSGKIGNSDSIRIDFIKQNFHKKTIIGTWQSGATGFYCENVYNLDGKIDNSALQYARSFGIEKYIELRNIEVLIEWEYWINKVDRKYLEKYWKLYSSDIGDGRTMCFVRRYLELSQKMR